MIIDGSFQQGRIIPLLIYINWFLCRSRKCIDPNGKQLVFLVKSGTDTSLLWKATVKIACVKVNPETRHIDSYKFLNLKQFLCVFKTFQSHLESLVSSEHQRVIFKNTLTDTEKFFVFLHKILCDMRLLLNMPSCDRSQVCGNGLILTPPLYMRITDTFNIVLLLGVTQWHSVIGRRSIRV